MVQTKMRIDKQEFYEFINRVAGLKTKSVTIKVRNKLSNYDLVIESVSNKKKNLIKVSLTGFLGEKIYSMDDLTLTMVFNYNDLFTLPVKLFLETIHTIFWRSSMGWIESVNEA